MPTKTLWLAKVLKGFHSKLSLWGEREKKHANEVSAKSSLKQPKVVKINNQISKEGNQKLSQKGFMHATFLQKRFFFSKPADNVSRSRLQVAVPTKMPQV